MLITYHGHSQFLLESGNVFRILTDPYDAHVGYSMRDEAVDLVLISHKHGDHSFEEKLTSPHRTIREAGEYSVAPGVNVTAIESDHDDEGGSKRGKTLLFVVEAEGLRVVHLGDLGRVLTEEEVARLGRVDVLMVPVGGFFTLDAAAAAKVAEQLQARVVIPMHYKTAANAEWPIADEKAFLALRDAQDAQAMPLVRITAGDLAEQPALCLLTPRLLP